MQVPPLDRGAMCCDEEPWDGELVNGFVTGIGGTCGVSVGRYGEHWLLELGERAGLEQG